MTDLLTATEAAKALGIKRASLYVYVSRGLLSSQRVPGSNARAYRHSDVERLKARRTSPAAGALWFGDPVLDTSITALDALRGPLYRGHAAIDLARRGVSFEAVAVLLWTGQLPGEARPRLHDPRSDKEAKAAAPTLALLEARVLSLRRRWPALVEPGVELALAKVLLGSLQASLWHALGVKDKQRDLLDKALVVVADHELNPSTFAARVVASTGADLATCVHAGLLALSGPRHGGACDRIEALLDEIKTPARAFDVVRARLKRGDDIPGFFANVYPQGDPRTAVVLEDPRVAHGERTAVVRALVQAMADLRAGPNDTAARGGPSIDLGLVAVARALGFAPGAATALFALGRSAGWIAHVMEQRGSEQPLRPRARFVA